jgi:hypothetical protein
MDGYSQRKKPVVRFLAQQDGQPERKLQVGLTKRFTEMRMVEQAYLARVQHGNEGATEVALALVSPTEDQAAIVTPVTNEFHAQFNVNRHLDT